MGCRFNATGSRFWACSTFILGDAMTKKDAVYMHLQKRKNITSWEAITLYRATRLADIVYKLKKQGFDIETVIVEKNGSRFAQYCLH
jgi:hypothetical protein